MSKRGLKTPQFGKEKGDASNKIWSQQLVKELNPTLLVWRKGRETPRLPQSPPASGPGLGQRGRGRGQDETALLVSKGQFWAPLPGRRTPGLWRGLNRGSLDLELA
jgi:hypothetical protein